MNNTKHSPLPFDCDKFFGDKVFLLDEKTACVATFNSQADADFAKKACNNHYQLLARLEGLLEQAIRVAPELNDGYFNAAIAYAEKAIAEAEK